MHVINLCLDKDFYSAKAAFMNIIHVGTVAQTYRRRAHCHSLVPSVGLGYRAKVSCLQNDAQTGYSTKSSAKESKQDELYESNGTAGGHQTAVRQ